MRAVGGVSRRVLVKVNLAAISRNVRRLRGELRPGVGFCAVVKADGYGHGIAQSAHAAIAGGASWLAVAGAEEAVQLRNAGLADVPLLVMGALSEVELREALGARADVVIWHEHQLAAVRAAGGGRVHVKLDTGMGRLGTRDVEEASKVLRAAQAAEGVQAIGLMTHFATADERDDGGFFEDQLESFRAWVSEAKADAPRLIAHAANSAATLREPAAHFDMVRCGVAIYGLDPFGEDPAEVGLEPALELCSYVAEVKSCEAGQSAGYGRRFIATHDTCLVVLPIGYGDGWRRSLSPLGAKALIGGRRHPLVGTISMDNLTVELGAQAIGESSPIGSEAVLIGAQGGERITAEEVARLLSTINYEITCGLTPRAPRVYHEDGEEPSIELRDAVRGELGSLT